MKIVQLVPWRVFLIALGGGNLWGLLRPQRPQPEEAASSETLRRPLDRLVAEEYQGDEPWSELAGRVIEAVAVWDRARLGCQDPIGDRSEAERTRDHMVLQAAERNLLRAFRPFRRPVAQK